MSFLKVEVKHSISHSRSLTNSKVSLPTTHIQPFIMDTNRSKPVVAHSIITRISVVKKQEDNTEGKERIKAYIEANR